MNSKQTFLASPACSLALLAAIIATPIAAEQSAQRPAQRAAQSQNAAPATFAAHQRRTRDEVAASQDFASECNLYGGGASTDPIGGETCTTPDGEDIIVPFP